MRSDRGYAMAALLVALSVMAILLSIALPVWRTAAQREREAELIFRGEQYAHAIELYARRTGGYPPSLDALEKGKFIRRLYKDPVAGNADFQPVFLGQVVGGQPVVPQQAAASGGGPQQVGRPTGQPLGQPAGAQTVGRAGTVGGGPVIGVVSTSEAASLRLYNGRGHYNEWAFVATEASQQAGTPAGGAAGQQTPPGTGQRGQPPGSQPGFRGRGPNLPAGGQTAPRFGGGSPQGRP
jgi:type II secretory pathway pseudopilin PulG